MNILFDGNYLFHKTFSIFSTYYKGQDMSLVLSDKEKQQVLLRKCVIDMCFTLKKFRDVKRVVFVIDSSSWRHACYNDYKYSLTRVREDWYKYFLEVLDMFEALLRKKGLIVSRVAGAEGDDLMYMWSVYFSDVLREDMVIITGDSDIRQIMNKHVSIYNNNSKNVKLFCVDSNFLYWSDYFDSDVEIVVTKPCDVLLYKVIVGDTSDNIPKLKSGFGEKTFKKFLEKNGDFEEVLKKNNYYSVANWIAKKFAEFANIDVKEIIEKVYFNLRMTWLSSEVYDKDLIERMTDDLLKQKDTFSYRGEYTLESFYGMVIK